MAIAFRVDASLQIGTGHFMRCLTLADALKQLGARTRFVSRHMPEHLRGMLAARGHEFEQLTSIPRDGLGDLSHSHWLGISQAADAQDSIKALSDRAWEWLVVDHYALDAQWETALRNTARRILVIDDIANRQHDCDVLLDQNLYADMETRYARKVPKHCQLLLGPRYALLRDEFRQLRAQAKPKAGPVKSMFVFFGGVDADNHTGRVIEALAKIDVPGLHVDVVIGALHSCREQVEIQCAQYGFACHVQTDQMAKLIAAADLAVGAGGSVTWERCCLGLPTLTICVSGNQSEQITDAACEGLLYAPELKGELSLMVRRHVSALMESCHLRYSISRNGMQAVDGRGVMRVVGSLGCGKVEIRVATPDDSPKLFEWRNHPAIRSVSRSTGLINWESHQKWLASVLADSGKVLLVGQRQGLPVGVVRFDIRGDEAEVSIYLIPGVKLSGQGQDLLRSAEQWFSSNHPEVYKVCAHVLGGNERSQRLFLDAGYQVESTFYSKRLASNG